MEVGVKFLEILQAAFEHACKHSEAQLGGLLVGPICIYSICTLIARPIFYLHPAFENSRVQIEFQGTGCIAERLAYFQINMNASTLHISTQRGILL